MKLVLVKISGRQFSCIETKSFLVNTHSSHSDRRWRPGKKYLRRSHTFKFSPKEPICQANLLNHKNQRHICQPITHCQCSDKQHRDKVRTLPIHSADLLRQLHNLHPKNDGLRFQHWSQQQQPKENFSMAEHQFRAVWVFSNYAQKENRVVWTDEKKFFTHLQKNFLKS